MSTAGLLSWPNAGNTSGLVRARQPRKRRRQPCQFCGRLVTLAGGGMQNHELHCGKNPNRAPRHYINPCDCGRVDNHGRPYMSAPHGGPCWKCLREMGPHPDLDELSALIEAGVTTPRAVLEKRAVQ